MAKEEGNAKDAAAGGGGKSSGILLDTPLQMDPVEARRHSAASKLQSIFRTQIASRLRAEAQLFGMFKKFKQAMSNHWEDLNFL